MNSKVWTVMNDLEMVTSKICSAREIIDAAIDRIQEHQYDKAETMMSAAYEFLEYYLSEFDEKFKLAWQETVVKQKENDCMPPWGHSDLEYGLQYTDEELTAMCDAVEKVNKVKKWILPIEQNPEDFDYHVLFPDDLLKAANLKEGDQIEWVDRGDGSYILNKVDKLIESNEC